MELCPKTAIGGVKKLREKSLLGLIKTGTYKVLFFSANGERIELSIECEMYPIFQLEVHLALRYGVNSSLSMRGMTKGTIMTSNI